MPVVQLLQMRVALQCPEELWQNPARHKICPKNMLVVILSYKAGATASSVQKFEHFKLLQTAKRSTRIHTAAGFLLTQRAERLSFAINSAT